MSIILSNSHLSLTTENDINSICKPLFAKTDITFFDYSRFFDDGSFYMLSSNKDVVYYQFEGEHPIWASPPTKFLRQKFHYFIPTKGAHSQVLYELRTFFNIDHVINFYEKGHGFVDTFGLGTIKKNDDIVNFYFNNIYFIENFICYFKEKISALHESLSQQKAFLPEYRRINFNSQNMSHLAEHLNFGINNPNLSKRETECIYHLSRGKSAKEIAQALDLSFRTVEFYIDNIKNKWGCSKRSELIDKALKNELYRKTL